PFQEVASRGGETLGPSPGSSPVRPGRQNPCESPCPDGTTFAGVRPTFGIMSMLTITGCQCCGRVRRGRLRETAADSVAVRRSPLLPAERRKPLPPLKHRWPLFAEGLAPFDVVRAGVARIDKPGDGRLVPLGR